MRVDAQTDIPARFKLATFPDLIDIQPRLLNLGFPQERSDATNNFARPIPIAYDPPGSSSSLVDIGQFASQPTEARAAVVDDCRKRLVDSCAMEAASSPIVMTRVTWASSACDRRKVSSASF